MPVKSEHTYPEKIVIGTRGSPLALWQANHVKDLLAKISSSTTVELRVINTSGDWRPSDGEVRLEALEGGKAQFAKELEEALLAGHIDMAVHSMKDMETVLPDGLVIPCILPREDARDAFISHTAKTLDDLPKGARIGTASIRRQAFVLHKRPDLKVEVLRGNVETRLDKLRNGQVDATFLAVAGLKRLGLEGRIASIMPEDDMLPSVAQGAIGIEIRSEDEKKMSFINQLNCPDTFMCVSCERAVLRALSGSCHTPVGVRARISGDALDLQVKVISPDGGQAWEESARIEGASLARAELLGENIGKRLKRSVPAGVLG